MHTRYFFTSVYTATCTIIYTESSLYCQVHRTYVCICICQYKLTSAARYENLRCVLVPPRTNCLSYISCMCAWRGVATLVWRRCRGGGKGKGQQLYHHRREINLSKCFVVDAPSYGTRSSSFLGEIYVVQKNYQHVLWYLVRSDIITGDHS